MDSLLKRANKTLDSIASVLDEGYGNPNHIVEVRELNVSQSWPVRT